MALEWNERMIQKLRQFYEGETLPATMLHVADDHDSVIQLRENAGAITLDQCFELYTKKTMLDGDNTYYCGKCKDHVRGTKVLGVWKPADVLIIQLKRFGMQKFYGRHMPEKLTESVEFPLDGLDIGPYVADHAAAKAQPEKVRNRCIICILAHSRTHSMIHPLTPSHSSSTTFSVWLTIWAMLASVTIRRAYGRESGLITGPARTPAIRRRRRRLLVREWVRPPPLACGRSSMMGRYVTLTLL